MAKEVHILVQFKNVAPHGSFDYIRGVFASEQDARKEADRLMRAAEGLYFFCVFSRVVIPAPAYWLLLPFVKLFERTVRRKAHFSI